jgi:hypothetical protein
VIRDRSIQQSLSKNSSVFENDAVSGGNAVMQRRATAGAVAFDDAELTRWGGGSAASRATAIAGRSTLSVVTVCDKGLANRTLRV